MGECLSREARINLVDWQREEVDVKTQADLLSLNRSSLYYQPMPPSAEEVALKHRIDECDPLVRNMRKHEDGLVAGELQHN